MMSQSVVNLSENVDDDMCQMEDEMDGMDEMEETESRKVAQCSIARNGGGAIVKKDY